MINTVLADPRYTRIVDHNIETVKAAIYLWTKSIRYTIADDIVYLGHNNILSKCIGSMQ